MESQPEQVTENMVVALSYVLTVENEVIEVTQEPLWFVYGHSRILPALERALAGMSRGQSQEVLIPAADAYGAYDPRMVSTVGREQFPADFVFVLGARLNIRDTDFMWYDAAISAIGPESIELDLNHPLAGKDLFFVAQVVDLRPASAAEIESGDVDE